MKTPLQPHKYDIWAANTLFFAFGLSVLMNFLRHTGYFASDLDVNDYLRLYLATPFILLVYYYIRKGMPGAKIFFLIIYGLVLMETLTSDVVSVTFDNTLRSFDFWSQHLLQIGACLLMLLSFLLIKLSSDKHEANSTGAAL